MWERSDYEFGMPLSRKELDFINCIELTGLTDIHSSGAYFTWSSKRAVGCLAKKLDRALGNDVWLDSFPNAIANFTPLDFFDHSAGILNFVPSCSKKSSFKIFNYLINHKDFLQTARDCWTSISVHGTQMYQLCAKLKALKAPLRSLNHSGFGGIHQRVTAAREKLLHLQMETLTHPSDDFVRAVYS